MTVSFSFRGLRRCAAPARLMVVAATLFCASRGHAESRVPEAAKAAFAAGNYSQAIEILNREVASSPRDAAIQFLLARCYFENEQYDRAVSSAEAAIALEPKNSQHHELLGRAYGEKAGRAGWLSALSLAKKARKEFDTAVQLDQHNYSAMQALIEYDCSAPGMAGGGEDKALPEIEKLSALDAAEGRYAAGNCHRQKKDLSAADAEFQKALAMHPKSADLIYDIGDYYMKHGSADRLRLVVEEGQRADPADPRGNFFRAVTLSLEQRDAEEAGKLFRGYLNDVPRRSNYPSKSMAHYWLGKIRENQNNTAAARSEYREALSLEPKNRLAGEALKHLRHD